MYYFSNVCFLHTWYIRVTSATNKFQLHSIAPHASQRWYSQAIHWILKLREFLTLSSNLPIFALDSSASSRQVHLFSSDLSSKKHQPCPIFCFSVYLCTFSTIGVTYYLFFFIRSWKRFYIKLHLIILNCSTVSVTITKLS